MLWSITECRGDLRRPCTSSALFLSADGQDSAGMISARLNRITDRWRTRKGLRRKALVQNVITLINLQVIKIL